MAPSGLKSFHGTVISSSEMGPLLKTIKEELVLKDVEKILEHQRNGESIPFTGLFVNPVSIIETVTIDDNITPVPTHAIDVFGLCYKTPVVVRIKGWRPSVTVKVPACVTPKCFYKMLMIELRKGEAHYTRDGVAMGLKKTVESLREFTHFEFGRRAQYLRIYGYNIKDLAKVMKAGLSAFQICWGKVEYYNPNSFNAIEGMHEPATLLELTLHDREKFHHPIRFGKDLSPRMLGHHFMSEVGISLCDDIWLKNYRLFDPVEEGIDYSTGIEVIWDSDDHPIVSRQPKDLWDRFFLNSINLSYDLETLLSHSQGQTKRKFCDPLFAGDYIMVIGAALNRISEKIPELLFALTLASHPSSSIERGLVILCASEGDMIEAFVKIMRVSKYAFFNGYNSDEFDNKYLRIRSQLLGVDETLLTAFDVYHGMPRDHGVEFEYNASFKMDGIQRDQLHRPKTTTKGECDTRLQLVRKQPKEFQTAESLNVMLKFYQVKDPITQLQMTKLDMPIAEMYERWATNSPDGIAGVVDYCMVDALASFLLLFWINYYPDVFAMAKLTYTTIPDALHRADGMRVTQMQTRYSRDLGVAFADDPPPSEYKQPQMLGRIGGGDVRSRAPGRQRFVISLDFKSEYPSMKEAFNIGCSAKVLLEMIVTPEKWDLVILLEEEFVDQFCSPEKKEWLSRTRYWICRKEDPPQSPDDEESLIRTWTRHELVASLFERGTGGEILTDAKIFAVEQFWAESSEENKKTFFVQSRRVTNPETGEIRLLDNYSIQCQMLNDLRAARNAIKKEMGKLGGEKAILSEKEIPVDDKLIEERNTNLNELEEKVASCGEEAKRLKESSPFDTEGTTDSQYDRGDPDTTERQIRRADLEQATKEIEGVIDECKAEMKRLKALPVPLDESERLKHEGDLSRVNALLISANAAQNGVKVVMNSEYGVGNNHNFASEDKEVAATVTWGSRRHAGFLRRLLSSNIILLPDVVVEKGNFMKLFKSLEKYGFTLEELEERPDNDSWKDREGFTMIDLDIVEERAGVPIVRWYKLTVADSKVIYQDTDSNYYIVKAIVDFYDSNTKLIEKTQTILRRLVEHDYDDEPLPSTDDTNVDAALDSVIRMIRNPPKKSREAFIKAMKESKRERMTGGFRTIPKEGHKAHQSRIDAVMRRWSWEESVDYYVTVLHEGSVLVARFIMAALLDHNDIFALILKGTVGRFPIDVSCDGGYITAYYSPFMKQYCGTYAPIDRRYLWTIDHDLLFPYLLDSKPGEFVSTFLKRKRIKVTGFNLIRRETLPFIITHLYHLYQIILASEDSIDIVEVVRGIIADCAKASTSPWSSVDGRKDEEDDTLGEEEREITKRYAKKQRYKPTTNNDVKPIIDRLREEGKSHLIPSEYTTVHYVLIEPPSADPSIQARGKILKEAKRDRYRVIEEVTRGTRLDGAYYTEALAKAFANLIFSELLEREVNDADIATIEGKARVDEIESLLDRYRSVIDSDPIGQEEKKNKKTTIKHVTTKAAKLLVGRHFTIMGTSKGHQKEFKKVTDAFERTTVGTGVTRSALRLSIQVAYDRTTPLGELAEHIIKAEVRYGGQRRTLINKCMNEHRYMLDTFPHPLNQSMYVDLQTTKVDADLGNCHLKMVRAYAGLVKGLQKVDRVLCEMILSSRQAGGQVTIEGIVNLINKHPDAQKEINAEIIELMVTRDLFRDCIAKRIALRCVVKERAVKRE